MSTKMGEENGELKERAARAEGWERAPFHRQHSTPCKIQGDLSTVQSVLLLVIQPLFMEILKTLPGTRGQPCPHTSRQQSPERGTQQTPCCTHLPLHCHPHHQTLLTTGFHHSNQLQGTFSWFPLLLPPPRQAAPSLSPFPHFHPQPIPHFSPKSPCLPSLLPVLPGISRHSQPFTAFLGARQSWHCRTSLEHPSSRH